MTIKEMRERLGMSREMFSREYEIPVRTLANWETGLRTPPPYLVKLLEHTILLREAGSPDPCYRYHVTADIYLSPSMMDVLYERSIISKEREVTDAVVESELRKYIGAFAEIDSIKVRGIRRPKHWPDEYDEVDLQEAMDGCPELMSQFERSEIDQKDINAAYKKKLDGHGKTKEATMDLVIDTVSEYFAIAPEDITQSDDDAVMERPRRISMYLSRIMTPSSLKAIQETFKEKDLSSTLHAIDDIETGIERDKDLFETVENLREKISNRLDKMKIPK